jgi:hypothetical protein
LGDILMFLENYNANEKRISPLLEKVAAECKELGFEFKCVTAGPDFFLIGEYSGNYKFMDGCCFGGDSGWCKTHRPPEDRRGT